MLGTALTLPMFQVGINLSDPIFRGVYHGKKVHDDDLHQVVQRALDVGCVRMMVTGSNLAESQRAIDLATEYRKTLNGLSHDFY